MSGKRQMSGTQEKPTPLPSSQSALSRQVSQQRSEGVRQIALDLMHRHGLHDWSFGFNRRLRSLGLCVFHRKVIELSVHLIERNGPEEVLDTILHEIAHALVGPGRGHDAVWKRKCLEVGAVPKSCSQAEMPEGRWRAKCKTCGTLFHRHRRPKRLKGWFCGDCGSERGGLKWQDGLAS
jgi:predicted SprT family Zn-dependent metalloprotease